MGHFKDELEAYRFQDWLELWLAPKKGYPPLEGHEKAAFYTRQLIRKNELPEMMKCLEIYREWAKTNEPVDFMALY